MKLSSKKRWKWMCFIAIVQFSAISLTAFSQVNTPLRRPTSTSSPMWIIHIDTWNSADPEKIIKLVPEEIRPYVVFNISLSVSEFVRGKYPFTICESWIRTCAEYRVWCMIQPASGYLCNFPNSMSEDYEYFYKKYPNFIGWNFAEQNWGFPSSNEFYKRLTLFVDLLKLADKYGGYLSVSNFMGVGNYTNVMGQLKDHAAFEQACKTYSKNYILQDKFTFPTGFYDNESAHLGAFLSGYAGHYGVRFDECGWRAQADPFAEASGIPAVLEHFLLTGATVTDGPETIPMQATRQIAAGTNSLGFTYKRFEMYPQMVDIHVDLFRKIIDGTFRIPGKQEVIDRTKIAYVNDLKVGTNLQKYSSDPSLYTGLYAMDGELDNNKTWFKKTGRYPAIPMMHKMSTETTNSFQRVVKRQDYATRWPDVQTKINEFNSLFPSEYSGDCYASRINNTWVTYNPYMSENTRSNSVIPFKYNTCESISLSYARFGVGIMNEYADSIYLYLNNYCTDAVYGMREDILTIAGCNSEPAFNYKDRGRVKSSVTKTWDNGTFILKIVHNGPLDLTIKCSGNAVDKLTNYPQTQAMIAPEIPPIYYGPRQLEGENFDYKSISSVGQTDLQNYSAMGYMNYGTNTSARVMDTITVPVSGNYMLHTKYRAPSATVNYVALYINNKRVIIPGFAKTVNDSKVWNTHLKSVYLKKGVNLIEYRTIGAVSSFWIDNVIITKDMYDFTFDTLTDSVTSLSGMEVNGLGAIGVVDSYSTLNGIGNCLRTVLVDTLNKTGVVNLNLFPSSAKDYTVIWKEHYLNPNAVGGILLRGSGVSSYAKGLCNGYLLVSQRNGENDMVLKVIKSSGNQLNELKSFSTNHAGTLNSPIWYRASAVGNVIKVEYSTDSLNWIGGTETAIIDEDFGEGKTQLVWGLGGVNPNWIIDNIQYLYAQVQTNPSIITELNYANNEGPSTGKYFILSGNSLSSNVVLNAPENFEISLNANTGFTSSLSFTPTKGQVASSLIYARLKGGLQSGPYIDTLTISSDLMSDQKVVLSGVVENPILTKSYTFESDAAQTTATTPPAKNITVGSGNTATAGVVSYTDKNGLISKVLKPYRGGQRESTGVLNLNLFSKQATNYSVTWKQLLGSETDNYKIGLVLRGDPTKIGDGTVGYVTGMMQGYVFLAYTNRGSKNTEFRIYKSTAGTGLEMYGSGSSNRVNPTAGQPVWFRATVTGNTIVYLTLDYSLDGTSWSNGAKYTDNEASYLVGGTQLVWGLGAGSTNFYYDDIVYNGVALDERSLPTSIGQLAGPTVQVVLEKYYNIMGQLIPNPEKSKLKGQYIIQSILSDGSTRTRKEFFE